MRLLAKHGAGTERRMPFEADNVVWYGVGVEIRLLCSRHKIELTSGQFACYSVAHQDL